MKQERTTKQAFCIQVHLLATRRYGCLVSLGSPILSAENSGNTNDLFRVNFSTIALIKLACTYRPFPGNTLFSGGSNFLFICFLHHGPQAVAKLYTVVT